MTAEDAEIIRTIRRELSRRPLDPTRADIQVVNGRVTLAGVITTLRDKPGINLQHEMDLLQKLLMRDRMIKDVSINVRLIIPEKDDETTNTRGRTRGGH